MKLLKKLWNKFDNKKSAIGATSFLLWVAIYAMPAFGPDYNWIVQYGTQLRDFLLAHGIVLDNTLFNVGTGATLIGLLDKFRKTIKAPK